MKTYIVDAFTNKPFKGNPAGVCLAEKDMDPALMLSIAQELGLSETAFISKGENENRYAIRYFSPKNGDTALRPCNACFCKGFV